ncbi:transcriptional regulator with XRE-family HTH domain [Clostridium pascui]|uniref:helix-turn-helix domain-containing protein n=1 Tax=Clostridium pascui TaxID=46609 RepID=UPI001FB00BB6|nr:helix-turn-helix domain-containing protein [Clostridium pascui]MBM7869340.1 transcriptional regulator with XRE-family HTH domain [Clostridium pascui]
MFGENIKRIRELKGLGVNELSRLSGVNASYISAMERGEKENPTIVTLKKLADALEVTVDELMRSEPITEEKLRKWDKKYSSRDLSEKANYIELGKAIEECRKYKEYSITNLVSRIAQDDNKRKKIEKIIYDLEHYNWTKEKLSKPDLIELLSKIATETNTSYPATFEKYVDEIYADVEKSNQLKEESELYTTGEFTTPEAAMQFILKQPAVMGFGGFDIKKMSDDEIVEFANELLNQLKLISYKYKK